MSNMVSYSYIASTYNMLPIIIIVESTSRHTSMLGLVLATLDFIYITCHIDMTLYDTWGITPL